MRKQITLEPPETMSKDDQIRVLESKLAEPGTPARAAASISRQISILKGDIEPGVYRHESQAAHYERKQRERAAEQSSEDRVPDWWTEKWQRVELVTRIDSQRPITSSARDKALDECEKRWAAEVGLSIEDFRRQVWQEGLERKARLYPNGMPRNSEEWTAWDLAHPEEAKAVRAALISGSPSLAEGTPVVRHVRR